MNFQNQTENTTKMAAANAMERDAMMQTDDGRAILFVKEVLACVAQGNQAIGASLPMLPVAEDAVVGFALALLAARKQMENNMFKDSQVKIGYHYTKEANLSTIRTFGLTDPNNAHHRRRHGNVFGNGIYVGSNPYAFDKYGDCCLLVAMLLGQASRLDPGQNDNLVAGLDTMIGNKEHVNLPAPGEGAQLDYYDEIVLRNSCQVVPLIWFRRADLWCLPPRDDSIWRWHTALQQVVDIYLNNGKSTPLQKYVEELPAQLSSSIPSPQWSVAWTGPAATAAATVPPAAFGQPAPSSGFSFGLLPSNSTSTGASGVSGFQSGFPPVPTFTFGNNSSATGPTTSGVAFGSAPSPFPSSPSVAPGAATTFFGSPAPSLFPTAASFPATPNGPGTSLQSAVAAQKPRSAPSPLHSSHAACWGQPAPQQPCFSFGMVPPCKRVLEESLDYRAPQSITSTVSRDKFQHLVDATALQQDCTICLDALNKGGGALQIKSCGHSFHSQCIESALNAANKCPICRKPVGEPQGTCPSGTLTIKNLDGQSCSGYDSCSTIELTYTLDGGTQMPYHDNPGHWYKGTHRVAYLPNNKSGQDLLKRLKYAWGHGLTFVIGTSMTTGRPNSVIWGSIHHKTSLRGGMSMHGFPDDSYFLNANEELDALFVPKAEDL